MKSFTSQSLFALVAVALMSSCSRPYATFQKTTPERFYSKTTVTPAENPVTADQQPVTVQPAEAVAVTETMPAVPATKADVEAELQKVDALVSTKAGLSTNKKVTRHLARVTEMVAEARAKVVASTATSNAAVGSVAPQKMSLVKRLVAKSMDSKIHNKMAPKKTMVRSILSIGIIVGLIGLLLLLIGTGTVASLGYVALVVGIILVIAGLL